MWPERESDHKPWPNMELAIGAVILCLYMSVRRIYMAESYPIHYLRH